MDIYEFEEMRKTCSIQLPERDCSQSMLERYLRSLGISYDVINYFVDFRMLYQHFSKKKYCLVFIGNDADETPRHAAIMSTDNTNIEIISGSSESYGFSYHGLSEHLYVFDSHIDLLAFATLHKFGGKRRVYADSLLSITPRSECLNQTSDLPPVLMQFLSDHSEIKYIHLCFSNTPKGQKTAKVVLTDLAKKYSVTNEPPSSGETYCDLLWQGV